MLGTLSHIGIYDKPPNVPGAVCFGHIRDALDVTWSDAVDNNETCRIVLPPTSRGLTMVGNRRVVVLHFSSPLPGGTGGRRVFRIWDVVTEKSSQGIRTIVQGRSLTYDFSDAGPVAYQYAGGFKSFVIAGSLTWGQWWDTYLEPHLARNGYGFYARTAASTVFPVRISADRWTAAQFMAACREQTDFEWQLIEYGGQLLVDLQSQRINSSLAPIVIRAESNALQMTREKSSTEQATVIVPIGDAGHSDSSRTVQHFRPLEVNTRDYVNKTVQFLAFSLDGVSLVGKYLTRLKTGRCFLILGQSGSILTLDALTNAGAGDEAWELRESVTPGDEINVPDPAFPLRVNGTPSGTSVVIDNPFSAADASATDDVHIDCRLRASPLILATTASNVAAVSGSNDRDITFASLTGVAVGDWGFLSNSASTPWGLFSKVFTVVQIISGTVARVRARYSFDANATVTATGAITKQAQFYRARASVPYVNDETASSNTLAVSSIAGLANGDLLEYLQDNSGATLTGLPSALAAAPPNGYGIAQREQSYNGHRCIYNLLHNRNPWFDSWVGASIDSWTTVSGSVSQLTTGLPGPGTVAAVALSGVIRLTNPVYLRPTSGDSKVSCRVQLRTAAVGLWTGSVTITISILAGTGGLGTSLVLVPPDHPSPPAGSQAVDPDTIVTADVLSFDALTNYSGQYPPWHGVKVQIANSAVAHFCDVGGVFLAQDSTLPPNADMVKEIDAGIWDLGQVALAQYERPLEANSIDALALQQLLQGTNAVEFVKGRTVRVIDDTLGNFDDRIMALEYQASIEGSVRVQVRTRIEDISQLLARQLIAVG